jgi:hypothetical protein
MVGIVENLSRARRKGRAAVEPKLPYLGKSRAAGPTPEPVLAWQG